MDAMVSKIDKTGIEYNKAEELSLCPECGSVMQEVDRLREGLYLFIWLKCTKIDCGGQWLQKKPCL